MATSSIDQGASRAAQFGEEPEEVPFWRAVVRDAWGLETPAGAGKAASAPGTPRPSDVSAADDARADQVPAGPPMR